MNRVTIKPNEKGLIQITLNGVEQQGVSSFVISNAEHAPHGFALVTITYVVPIQNLEVELNNSGGGQ
jgi:hypothetical protein